jgi:hypothetical protein
MNNQDIEKLLSDHGYGAKSKPKGAAPDTAPIGAAPTSGPDFITARKPAWEHGAELPVTDFNVNQPPPAAAAATAPPPTETIGAETAPQDTTLTKGIPGVVPGIKIDPLDRDFARGVLKLGGQARRLGHWLAPHLEELAEQALKKIPGAREAVHAGREFAHQPEEEPFGETLGETVPLMMVDPLLAAAGVEPSAMAARFAARYLPRTAGRAAVAPVAAGAPQTVTGIVPMYVPGQGVVRQTVTRTFPGTPAIPGSPAMPGVLTKGSRNALKWIKRGTKAAEVPLKGAAGGALGDPEHPEEGAVAGAIGSTVPPLALGTAAAKFGLGHLLPASVAGLAHSQFNIPRHVAGRNISWYYSPIGRQLHRVGHWIVDHTGKIIGRISVAAGHAAGEFEEENPDTLSSIPGGVMDIAHELGAGGDNAQ